MRKVDGRYGEIWYYGKDEYVGRSIHNYGEFSPAESETIVSLAASAGTGTCLDIGANIGCISQALEAAGETVIAFEPQPEIYALLRKNIKGLCYNIALGSADSYVKMPKIRYGERGNYGGIGIASRGSRSALGFIDVKCHRLDDIISERIKFVKIDVEGYEIEVLRGAKELIMRDRPVMYIEDDRLEKRDALRAYIEELGYTWKLDVTHLYRENNYFGKKELIWDKDYVSYNLICSP
jgi:FkbM family methyltransferase